MGKGRNLRKRSEKTLRSSRKRRNKLKSSKWKLDMFPEEFSLVNNFPYVIRRIRTKIK